MKKVIKIQICLDGNSFLSDELERVSKELIFSKISLLENYYLKGVACYPDEILMYLRFLKESVFLFKSKYFDWSDTWNKEIKPYILSHFLDDKLLHERKYKSGSLYDCLHDIARYSDLHTD